MSGTITVQAIKPTPDSKVGITITSRQGAFMVTSITDTSIFLSSALRIGHVIVKINETNLSGMSIGEVQVLLGTAIKTVVLTIRLPSTLWNFSYEKRLTKDPLTKTGYICNSDRSIVPPYLSDIGVSAKIWAKIVDVCNAELLPAIKASDEHDKLLATQMQSYAGNQMVKGALGFGMESNHEKKVLKMIQQAAILNNNMSLLTYKVVTMANALLNSKHNVMIQPSFAATDINHTALKTNGLTFVLMDD